MGRGWADVTAEVRPVNVDDGPECVTLRENLHIVANKHSVVRCCIYSAPGLTPVMTPDGITGAPGVPK